jgi:hypothetical protein
VAVQVIAGRMIDHYVVEFPGGSEVLCTRGIGIEMNKESNLLYRQFGDSNAAKCCDCWRLGAW